MSAINRAIIVQADSRYLTQRVFEAMNRVDDAETSATQASASAAQVASEEPVEQAGAAVAALESIHNITTEKWLFTADWQLRLDDGKNPPNFYPIEEQNRRRNFLRAQIAKIEPGVGLAFFNGDLVDRPHLKVSGAATRYGFKEFREDIGRTGISMDSWFFLPGNHEADHIDGDIPTRATTEECQRWIGPTSYYIFKGNMAHVFVGEEAGFGSQEIMTQTLAWLNDTLDSLRGLNIWLHFHAPIYGAHPNVTSDNSQFAIRNSGFRSALNACSRFWTNIGRIPSARPTAMWG